MKSISAQNIMDSFDAHFWAKQFVDHASEYPGVATDESTMQTWFTNVLMAGFDMAKLQMQAELSEFDSLAEYLESLV